jgi:hypothetical protein
MAWYDSLFSSKQLCARYDTKTGTWSACRPLIFPSKPRHRGSLQLTTWSHLVYVFHNQRVSVYDIITDTWKDEHQLLPQLMNNDPYAITATTIGLYGHHVNGNDDNEANLVALSGDNDTKQSGTTGNMTTNHNNGIILLCNLDQPKFMMYNPSNQTLVDTHWPLPCKAGDLRFMPHVSMLCRGSILYLWADLPSPTTQSAPSSSTISRILTTIGISNTKWSSQGWMMDLSTSVASEKEWHALPLREPSLRFDPKSNRGDRVIPIGVHRS